MWTGAEEIAWMRSLEAVRSPLGNGLTYFLNVLGDVPGYLILAPVVYWLNRHRDGIRILVGLLLCMAANVLLKDWVHEPRPYQVANLTPLFRFHDGSFPSGHAQVSTLFWLSIMTLYPRRWVFLVVPVLIVAIGLSRVYSGVHFPHDVLAGWGLGGLFYFAFSRTSWDLPIPRAVSSAALLSLLWLDSNPSLLSLVGTLLGVHLGCRWLAHEADGNNDLSVRSRTVAIFLGVSVLVVLYSGLTLLRAHLGAGGWQSVMVGAGFVGIGLWLTLGYQKLEATLLYAR
jgi:undecaprenyl-diphosphatase